MEEKIVIVLNEMSEYLSITQMKKLQEVIIKTFADNEVSKVEISNEEFLEMFLDAKRIEGCSERTIIYYQATVKHLLSQITTEVRKITTEEIREYLSNYQKRNNCSNVTIDNVRRNISSFFSWLEEEDYILKSPMKRIHSISTELFITKERFFEIKDKYGVPKKGDLLVSAVGTIGVIWIVDGSNDFYFKDGNLIRVDASEKFDSVYMKNLLENLIDDYKKQMSTGTTYNALTISGLTKLKVYDVPIELQNLFSEFVNQVYKSKVVA